VTSALYANAIEPIYVATYYYDKDLGRTGRAIKNSVDMNLCIDAMKTLFTNTNISKFVLVTGDRDFIPLVNSIRQQGKEVYIIGIGGAASTHLAQSADEFVFYEQLIGRQPGGSAAATAIANRATELNRGIEVVYEPVVPVVPPPPAVHVAPVAPAEPDIYTVLIEAIHLVRKRGYVSTLGSIKLVMKELMGGDFKESRYRDLNGRPFAKFKDFVMDAEKRGKVQIFTNGTVNEVFLPGEDPYKLSQFAAALSEEVPPVEPVLDTTVLTNGRKEREAARAEVAAAEPAATPVGRRRRRRSRRGQGGVQSPADGTDLNGVDEADLEEPDYTPPLDDFAAIPSEDELVALDALDEPGDLGFDDDLPFDLDSNGLPADLLAEEGALEETAAALGLVDIPDLPPDDEAWDAAASAVAAANAPPADEVWDAAAVVVAPPADEAWDAAASAVAADSEADAEPLPAVVSEADAEPLPAVVSEADAEPLPAVDEADEELVEQIAFTDQEWAIFSGIMSGFTKAASFQQIFDTLRSQRKERGLVRTNEQLRTMVKQAINSGLLERSGRGKRVYYTLRPE
jgi:hypothetical protein